MSETPRTLDNLEIVGGHPAVNFVNTVSAWNVAQPADYLTDLDDFLEWCEQHGLLWKRAAAHFTAAPARDKAAAFAEVRKLRDSLHAVFAARAAAKPLPQDRLDHLNELIRQTVAWRRVAADEASGGRDICCVWDFHDAPAIAALGPVTWLAADFLERGDMDRLKACPGEQCGWLFVDASRNRSRHWCSMKTCGNTAKVKRFRQRARRVSA